jgi:hypothetical protein
VVERRSSLDLLASYLNVETGQWADVTDQAPNPPDDSFYEYLWGGWAMFGDRDCLNWYRMFTAAFKKYLIETYNGRTWFRQVNFETGQLISRDQSELAAFYGEVLARGGDVALGESYYRSWADVARSIPSCRKRSTTPAWPRSRSATSSVRSTSTAHSTCGPSCARTFTRQRPTPTSRT